MSTITTTIRWTEEELNRVKKSATKVGLPVALFVKSLTLLRVNEEKYSTELVKELLAARQEALSNKVDTFNSLEDLLIDLKKYLKKNNENQANKKISKSISTVSSKNTKKSLK